MIALRLSVSRFSVSAVLLRGVTPSLYYITYLLLDSYRFKKEVVTPLVTPETRETVKRFSLLVCLPLHTEWFPVLIFKDQFPQHFLCDGASLLQQFLRQQRKLVFVEREAEVPPAVPAVRQRTVVVAEEGLLPDALLVLLHVDVAVAHQLHVEVSTNRLHLRILAAHKVHRVQPVLQLAVVHHTLQRYLSLSRNLNLSHSYSSYRLSLTISLATMS